MPTVTLTNDDNGKTVHANKGDTVAITLNINASNGFVWTNDDTTIGKLLSISHSRVDPTKPGAPALITFTFAVENDSGYITLTYARPNDTATPEKWFFVTIVVDKK